MAVAKGQPVRVDPAGKAGVAEAKGPPLRKARKDRREGGFERYAHQRSLEASPEHGAGRLRGPGQLAKSRGERGRALFAMALGLESHERGSERKGHHFILV